MKRKLPLQVTLPSSSSTLPAAEFTTKNLRSKIPRRKRSHISPIIRNSTSNNNCDDLSCNTTLQSAVLLCNEVVPNKIQQVSVSERSCVESCSAVVAATEANSNHNGAVSFSVAQHSPANTTATVEQKSPEVNSCNSGGYYVTGVLADDDLECNESYSELQSSEFSSSSNGNNGGYNDNSQYEDYTDEYTPSIWMNNNDSDSQFSERSSDDDSAPSPCFSLFQEFKQQFLYLNSECATDDDDDDVEVSSLNNDHYVEELAYWTFEDEEDEESYRLLRSRERNEAVKVTNYIEEYHNETVFGGIIVEQRLLMVNWIIQLSRKKDLQSETMFLGVRLFDRFLSKGCFASRRNLQILGIACLTLAIRVEENQPYNSVRQKCFRVGSNIYSKTEVVAMEWMVQEVLQFHCISATVYNFLWFYLKAAEANEQMRKKAEYLASLTLLDYMQLRFWPSSVAAALVILVSLSAEQDELCQRIMEVSYSPSGFASDVMMISLFGACVYIDDFATYLLF
ncbi:hypothetical protein KSS87_006324 [Heliosperma pusillum]|nr:hypothetical protein KSS87_006324 [Heliosperma pusillum]